MSSLIMIGAAAPAPKADDKVDTAAGKTDGKKA